MFASSVSRTFARVFAGIFFVCLSVSCNITHV